MDLEVTPTSVQEGYVVILYHAIAGLAGEMVSGVRFQILPILQALLCNLRRGQGPVYT